MICGNCNTVNDPQDIFCVNCGNSLNAATGQGGVAGASMATVIHPGQFQPTPYVFNPGEQAETETAVVSVGRPPATMPGFVPDAQYPVRPPARSGNTLTWIAGGLVGLIVLLGLVVVGIFVIGPRLGSSEMLPDHLGMFVQSKQKDRVDEIRKQDFTSAIEARNSLAKSDDLPAVDAQPNMLLYADGKDTPITDVRLVQLDTIKDDGSIKQIEFQASPVDGKPEIKRLRLPDSLAVGKYAFALLDGYFNEGKHKFWAFQVKDSPKADNGDALKAVTVNLKPTPPPTPKPTAEPKSPPTVVPNTPPPPPSGGRQTVVASRGNTFVRSSPCLTCPIVGKISGGQVVNIINYSSNYDTWGGRYGNWAYVETGGGLRGWVFAPLLR